MKTRISFFSWNVLSSNLLHRGNYFFLDSESPILNPTLRYQCLIEEVNQRMLSKSIISLCEVNLDLYNLLYPVFLKNDYAVLYVPAGPPINGFMGSLLAWSKRHYHALETQNINLGQRLKSAFPPEPKPNNLLTTVASIVGLSDDSDQPDPIGTAISKSKWCHLVRLRDRADDSVFVVANTHIPCLFWFPEALLIVSDAFAAEVENFAKSDPALILGDLNFTPDSVIYKHLIEKDALIECPGRWNPLMKGKFSSLVADHLGSEPKWTTSTSIKGGDKFQSTLDYVLTNNSRFKITQLKTLNLEDRLLPDLDCQSDHLPYEGVVTLSE